MDFEGIGLAKAAGDRLRTANRIVDHANVKLQSAYDELDEKDALIKAKNAEIANLKRALLLEQSHSAGLTAHGQAFVEALKVVEPKNELFRETGRVFEKTGKRETAARKIYDVAFDAKALKHGLPEPHKLRALVR